MLMNGRLDAVVSNPAHMQSLANLLYPDDPPALRSLLPPVQVNYATPAIAANHPLAAQLVSEFNKAFSRLVEDGLYEEIKEVHGELLNHRQN